VKAFPKDGCIEGKVVTNKLYVPTVKLFVTQGLVFHMSDIVDNIDLSLELQSVINFKT